MTCLSPKGNGPRRTDHGPLMLYASSQQLSFFKEWTVSHRLGFVVSTRRFRKGDPAHPYAIIVF